MSEGDPLVGSERTQVFVDIYDRDVWRLGGESASGPGSRRDQTEILRAELPALLARLRVRTVLDLGCGDFNWMRTLALPVDEYIGADIVPGLIERNQAAYSGPGRRFVALDLVRDPLPAADLVLCRDVLVHLPNEDLGPALEAILATGARYLLAGTFVSLDDNVAIELGEWRPLNLERPPLSLPPPLETILETPGVPEFEDKRLGLWDLDELRARRSIGAAIPTRPALRLVVVGFAPSVHTARYLAQLKGLGWDIHLFDSQAYGPPHPELRELTLHIPDDVATGTVDPSLTVQRYELVDGDWAGSRARALARLITELQPDVIHTHEIQHAAYLALAARRLLDGAVPPWLLTNWGSDISLFALDPDHRATIVEALGACDYYSSECHRDVAQARLLGFRGKVIGVFPVAGGFDLARCRALRVPGRTSERRTIALKGADNRFSRGGIAAEALARCGDRLSGYELCVYNASDEMIERCRRLCERHSVQLTVISRMHPTRSEFASHAELLAMHGRARISISVNISDALSTSFMEAVLMGSLPIHSDTGCGRELTRAGALFVPAEDPDAIATAIARALEDDELVDAAADTNARIAALHLDANVTRARVIDGYERIVADRLAVGAAGP